MATPPQLTQIAFAGGLDESQHDEILDPAKAFLVAQNVRQDHRGGFTKRLGFDSLTRDRLSGSRSAGYRLLEHNGQPVVIDGSYLDSYSETATKNITRGRISECTYRLMDLPQPSPSSVVYDVEHCNGFIAIAYGSSLANSTSPVGQATTMVVSASTGETISDDSTVSALGMAVIGSYGSRYFIAFGYTDSTTALTAWYFDTQAPANGWVVIGTVAATTSNAYPAVASHSTGVFVAYGTTSGGSRVSVERYTIAGSAASTTITAASTPGKLSIDVNTGNTLWVCFSQSTNINVIGLNPANLASITSTATTALTTGSGVQNLGICEGSTSGSARAWVMETASTVTLNMCGITTVAGAAVAASATTVYNAVPTSRAFLQGGRYYMAVAPSPSGPNVNGNAQALCVVVDWTADASTYTNRLRPIANIEPGLAPSVGMFCKFATVSSTKRAYGFQVVKRGSTTVAGLIAGDGSGGCMLAELDFGSRNRWQGAKHGNSLFIGGALLSTFDGRGVREAGFLARPTTPTTSTGAGTLAGTYKYVAIYETTDAAGNVVVSGISSPVTATPATNNVTVSTRPYTVTTYTGLTNNVVFYRTVAGGEPPYYRLASVVSDGSLSSVSYADDTSDATLTTRSKLYAPNLPGTIGEAQDRRAPPGLVHLVSYNGMLVGAKGSSLFNSGQEVYGEATWFTPLFETPLPGLGDITGIRAQDGTLYVFREDRIYAVNGDPPTDNGSSGGLGTPRLIAADVGCIEANSLVVTSLGIFFQSRRGIELLTRSGSVVWVGEAIQRTMASYPVIASAVLDATNSLIRFSLAASESAGLVSGEGRDAIYDLTLQTWISIDDKIGSSEHEPSQDACMVKVSGTWRYAWLSTGGHVRFERLPADAEAYLEGTELDWITMLIETSWFKASGVQGRQHMNGALLLARKSTDANLSVSLAYNYETSFRSATEWTGAAIGSLLTSGWPVTQLRHAPHDDAECQSVRVRITDATPTGSGTSVGSGKGATLLALTLDITPKPGVFDVPEGAS